MEFGLGQDFNSTIECADANNFPLIRFTTFALGLPWAVASSGTACSGWFLMIGYATCDFNHHRRSLFPF